MQEVACAQITSQWCKVQIEKNQGSSVILPDSCVRLLSCAELEFSVGQRLDSHHDDKHHKEQDEDHTDRANLHKHCQVFFRGD